MSYKKLRKVSNGISNSIIKMADRIYSASLGIPNLAGFISNIINSYEIPRLLVQIELTESAKDASNEELRPLVEGLNMQR